MNKEVVDIFFHTEKKIFIDCTVGLGGHSYHILKKFENARLIAIDLDLESLKKAEKNLEEFAGRTDFYRLNFTNLFDRKDLSRKKISGILIDPGISTYQLKHQQRGFSHSINSPLDMRKDLSNTLTAYEVINSFVINRLLLLAG